jgi:hypothetical protein
MRGPAGNNTTFFNLGASGAPRRTGLSVPIFWLRQKDFHFNPLRVLVPKRGTEQEKIFALFLKAPCFFNFTGYIYE